MIRFSKSPICARELIYDMAIIRTLFAGIRFLTALAIIAVIGWLFRDEISGFLSTRGGDNIVMAEPSEELATNVEDTLRELMAGEGNSEIRLTETALQSYLQYRIGARFSPALDDLAIDLTDSTLLITGMLDLTQLVLQGGVSENLRRVMGDSAKISGEVMPEISAPGRAHLNIISLQAGVFPVPPFLIATALPAAAGIESDGSAVVLTIPDNVLDIRVEDEGIVLIQDR